MLNCNYSDNMINCSEPWYRGNSYSTQRTSSGWPYIYPYAQDTLMNTPVYNTQLGYYGNYMNTPYREEVAQPVFPQPVAVSDLRMRTVKIEEICE